ncbi:MAG: hypothetical protein WBA17_13080 [Saprospiraceae bacterium]
MRLLFTCLLLLCTTFGLYAQDGPLVTDIVATPNYFITIIAGVIIAAGIQFLLTALSVAIGVSAVPNAKEAYVHTKYPDRSDRNKDDHDDDKESHNYGVIISSALGVWNMITVAISLFVATLLALHLTHVVTPEIAITLSLCIWSLFFLFIFYLEGKAISTAVGGLISTAVSGLKATGQSIASMFAPSPAGQIENVADHTIEKIRKELTSNFDTGSINDTVDHFLDRVEKDVPDYNTIKKDIQKIVKENSGNSGGGGNPATWTAIQGVINKVIDEKGSGGQNKDKISQIKDLVSQLTDENKQNEAKQQGKQAVDQTEKQANQTKEQAQQKAQEYKTKVQDWLNKATPENMDQEKIQQQFQQLMDDPQGKLKEAGNYVQHLDRDTIVEAISKNTSLEKSQIDQYADKVENVINQIKEKVGGTSDGDGKSLPQQVLQRIEGSVAGFIDGTDDPRLNYDSLKHDVMRAINNPNESLDIVKNRLGSYDRDTLISVLTNNSKINRDDIHHIADRVEEAKHEVEHKIQEIEDKALATLNQVERRAAIQAEHARKTAIAAAWWSVATILVSGAAAVAGGTLGI